MADEEEEEGKIETEEEKIIEKKPESAPEPSPVVVEEESPPPPPPSAPPKLEPVAPRGQSIIPPQDQHSEEMDFSVSEGVDSEGRASHLKTKRPTEEIAMRLPPRIIIDKLNKYYKEFITLREELRTVEKEFGKLDRKRNRWKATEEELQLRLEKKKELQEKRVAFDLMNLKITKLKEAAVAKDIKSSDLPPEPPPLEEDEEDVCLPEDILPRVIVCNGYRLDRNDKLPEVPKIVVCLDDRCKPPLPPPTEEEIKEKEEASQPAAEKKKVKKQKTVTSEGS